MWCVIEERPKIMHTARIACFVGVRTRQLSLGLNLVYHLLSLRFEFVAHTKHQLNFEYVISITSQHLHVHCLHGVFFLCYCMCMWSIPSYGRRPQHSQIHFNLPDNIMICHHYLCLCKFYIDRWYHICLVLYICCWCICHFNHILLSMLFFHRCVY